MKYTIGSKISIDYIGPKGTVAVIISASVPRGTIVFVKDSVVVAILGKENMSSISDLPPAGSYDGCLCHPDDAPDKRMGQEWCDKAQAAARKKMS